MRSLFYVLYLPGKQREYAIGEVSKSAFLKHMPPDILFILPLNHASERVVFSPVTPIQYLRAF